MSGSAISQLGGMNITLWVLLLLLSMQVLSDQSGRVHYVLDVDGETFEFDSGAQVNCKDGGFLYPFPSIAKRLGGEFKYDSKEQVLTVIRAPDKAVFTLAFNDGLVTVNGQKVGFVPNIGETDSEQLLLNKPAVEVLTGSHIHCDSEQKRIEITLDKRLKPQFGFSMIVDGRPLAAVEVTPRSIGPVLLLPLKPIVKQLNQQLKQSEPGVIEIFRTQDSVTFALDLHSGLVKMNGTPIGITPNMSYARLDALLLPSTAIETLTGTKVRIIPGNNTIEINLDERLTNRVLPGELILEQSNDIALTAESLDFVIGNQRLNTLTFRSHVHEFNTRLHYEVPDFPHGLAETEPSWLAVDFDSLRGYSGSLGDYISKHRELREIGISRLRGLSLNKRLDSGWIIGAIGMPLAGSTVVNAGGISARDNKQGANAGKRGSSGIKSSFDSVNQSRPNFQGFAAGMRFLHQSQQWQAGISTRNSINGDSARLVGNIYKSWRHTDGFLKNANTSINVDLGFFSNGNDGPVDTRLRINHSMNPLTFLRVNFNSYYTGVNFKGNGKSGSASSSVSDEIRSSLSLNFRLPANTGLNMFGNWSQNGLRSDYVGNVVSYGANLSLQPFRSAPSTSISYTRSLRKTVSENFKPVNETASLWANQQFKWWYYSLRFEYDFLGSQALASMNLSHQPLEYYFQKQAVVSANAVATLIWSQLSGISGNLGGRIHADSGNLLGNNWKVEGNYTRFQPIPTVLAKNKQIAAQASNFLSISSTYRISRYFELGLVYSYDFQQQQLLRLSLRGHLGFNPPRRYKKILKGKGILKGQVFIDNNGDGVFQRDEKPLSGVVLRLEGTRLALRTDPDGYYTIANLPTGSFRVTIDEQQLPLGLVRESAYQRYATIGDGQITKYDIPMIQSG